MIRGIHEGAARRPGSGRGTTAVVSALCILALASCASVGEPQWVTDSGKVMERNGFSLLPPSGKGWIVAPSGPYGAAFGKPIMNPDGSRATLALQVSTGRFKDRSFDLRSEQGLRAATEYTAAGGDASRFKVVDASYSETYREQDTDCIRFDVVMEEHNNPMALNRGQVLLLSYHGMVCRHPSSDEFTLTAVFSERRPKEQASLLDEALRQEAEHSLKSIRFTPLKP